jgi:hypothetical protein
METWRAVLNSLMNLICGLLHKSKYFNEFQTAYHTVNTSPTRWIKTHRITASSITPQKLNNVNTKDFIYWPFLTYIILAKIIIIFNYYRVTTTQLTTLYLCTVVIIQP